MTAQNDDGVIELDIPMRLPLDNPGSVDFGSVAGQAIREALENLVSSPLETLSEVAGGGGEDGSDAGNDSGTGQTSAARSDAESTESDEDGPTALYERARTRQ